MLCVHGGDCPWDWAVWPCCPSWCWVTGTHGREGRAENSAGWCHPGELAQMAAAMVNLVPSTILSPYMGSLSGRAEVILGNILKKKGWRYGAAPSNQRDPGEMRILLVFHAGGCWSGSWWV